MNNVYGNSDMVEAEKAARLAKYFSAIDMRLAPESSAPPGWPFEGAKATTVGEGKKFDSGKPDYTLLPMEALEEVAQVLGFGANKYGRDNWQNVNRQRYIAAAFRHLIEIAKGKELDEESGRSHAAHLSCCALFLGSSKENKA